MNGLLKFITCGSVDDGKSTLIGHMLYDAKLIYTDQEKALELESKVGSCEGGLDYSLLLDGLMAEREQGITIDVAYRYFTTERRSFIVADTPGHEEYTRNMAVGASFAELAVILVDAGKGILPQTRRHARICRFMGIRDFIFALNKMDLIHYNKNIFLKIEKDIKKLAVDLELDHITVIPVSATEGDNVTVRSDKMPWYQGKTLLSCLEETVVSGTGQEGLEQVLSGTGQEGLEQVLSGAGQEGLEQTVSSGQTASAQPEPGFVMPVQRVCRPNHSFRGFQGQIEAGRVAVGDQLTILPSGERAEVSGVLVGDKEAAAAGTGQPVTLTLDREVDVSRGCVLMKEVSLHCGTMFTAMLLWMDDAALVSGRNFYLKLGTRILPATILQIKYQVDIHSGEHLADAALHKNEIGCCDVLVSDKVVFAEFRKYKSLGSFILIDRVTNMTSACGVIEHPLRRAETVTWQTMDVTREFRAGQMNQKPMTIWFTGLSGSGKSTLANALEKRLSTSGKHTMLLDGDNIRLGLNRNLGFTEKDRVENIRRIAEVSRLMNDAGLIVLTSFISPYRSDRDNAGEIIGREDFIEIYVSTPLEECERRDVKGLYKRARQGEIPNFTGISSPYEEPLDPQLRIDTSRHSLEACVDIILEELKKSGRI